MSPQLRAVPPVGDIGLSIGELAERTGVKATTLRAWEERYGFPVPDRRASGHRRYPVASVAQILEVLALRDSGTRLGAAISHVVSQNPGDNTTASTSVFADLRAAHPGLQPQRLRKSTLLAVSWALEDEILARAGRAHLFGSFQRERFYSSARDRWLELARGALAVYVFADFPDLAVGGVEQRPAGPVLVPLPEDSPMMREWSVVCDMAGMPCAMVAWELPGQQHRPDRDRTFEAIWTLDPAAVRTAARSCASSARSRSAAGAAAVETALDLVNDHSTPDPAAMSALVNRVLSYVDSPPR